MNCGKNPANVSKDTLQQCAEKLTTTVYLQSVRWCSVPPPLLGYLCNYLKTIPCINDPSPCYQYLGRKYDFFILDWVGYVFQSPTWQFQNGHQPPGFKYKRKVLALFTPTCLLNICLVLWLRRTVCIFLFISLILKLSHIMIKGWVKMK